MPRGIDHFVIAVRDLDAARDAYSRLGFSLTPVARHPFGTANFLIQLADSYVELIAVADPPVIPEATDTTFSFAAFNRDFLKRREGPSMLALKSADAVADRAAFEAADLPVYEPLRFSRQAKGPDGVEREVAFSLAFTSDARMPDAGFFTCQHHFPENFWRREYQTHANGALRMDAVVMAARDPADIHIFLTFFTGQHDIRSDSLGIDFDLGNGHLQVMSPAAARAFLGVEFATDERARFIGMRIAVPDLAATRALLTANAVAFSERQGALVVAPHSACGAAVAFAADKTDGA
jgi:hypothetical protein